MNAGSLYVGHETHGTLNISDGSLVKVRRSTYVTSHLGSSGAINMDNGTLTTGSFTAAVSDLSGTGTINTNGLLSDVDLVFDSSHGLSQTLNLTGPGRNITLNLNVDGSGRMGAGCGSAGSIHISDGLDMQSTMGTLGFQPGSTGVVTVTGEGSSWIAREFHIGRYGDGTLNIINGGDVSGWYAQIGRWSGSTSEVTVSGAGSTWTNDIYLAVGMQGRGELNILDSGQVTVNGETRVARDLGSTGAINFDNGSLSTGGLLVALDDLSGAGTINTNGLVSDVDLVFDSSHGLSQTLNLTGPGRDITVHLSVDGSQKMGAGYGGTGSMRVSDGMVVQSNGGYIGYLPGSNGTVMVDGAASSWVPGSLYVGYHGDGTLEITDGGSVSNRYGCIGTLSGSTGAVTVSGAGSTWGDHGYRLTVGFRGAGRLHIDDGALVSVAGQMIIDQEYNGGSFVTMATGGMLALKGYASSLTGFLDLIDGSDDILYWDDSMRDWANIIHAMPGEDYTLVYLTDGDLADYTVLTVNTVPEPATLILMAGGLPLLLKLRRRWN